MSGEVRLDAATLRAVAAMIVQRDLDGIRAMRSIAGYGPRVAEWLQEWGIEIALGRSPDVAVNHSRAAIAMHEANHPRTRHLCASVWDVSPREVCGRRRVDLVCPPVAAALIAANVGARRARRAA